MFQPQNVKFKDRKNCNRPLNWLWFDIFISLLTRANAAHLAQTFLDTEKSAHAHTELWKLSWSFSKAERDSSPQSSPGEVSSRQPWVPVQLLPLSGGGQRVRDKAPCDTELSAWVWSCLLGGTLKIVWVCLCVCIWKIFMQGFASSISLFVKV